MRFTSLVLSACVLSACGGGGGSDGTVKYVSTLATGQAVSAPTAYESAYVSPNATYHPTAIALPASGLPVTGPNTVPSFFYDVAMSLPASPNGATQQATAALPVDLTKTPLGLPQSQYTSTYLADGGFYKQGSPAKDEISYSNGEVVDTPLSEDGKHRLTSVALVQLNLNPLTGTIVSAKDNAPGLLPDEIYTNASLIDQTARWGTGAAYVKVTSRYNTDTYYVYSPSAPAASNTTIDTLIANKMLITMPGTSTTVQGIPVFVASSAQAGGSVPTYTTFYQLNGNVYSGAMVRAGSVSTGISGYNVQARDSIKAALKF